jgi:hypothetical protein
LRPQESIKFVETVTAEQLVEFGLGQAACGNFLGHKRFQRTLRKISAFGSEAPREIIEDDDDYVREGDSIMSSGLRFLRCDWSGKKSPV